MLSNLLITAFFIFAALLAYRFHRPVLDALKRFDARNKAQDERERGEKRDPLAHIRRTMEVLDEQVEEIGEITLWDVTANRPVTRYLFEGQRYASFDEAEMARAKKVGNKARAFYAELPAALSAPKDSDKS